MDGNVRGFEEERLTCGLAGVDQIRDHFVLSVDGDGASGERGKVDAMPHAAEGKIDAFMPHAFFRETAADTSFVKEIDRALFQHAGANAFDHVSLRAVFDDDRFDAFQMEQMRQQEPCRTRTDNPDLRADIRHAQ